jgi:very-short-patch-repair endonuclease
VPGYPPSFQQRLMVAVLAAGPGAAASHRSAAALLGLDGVDQATVEVSVPPERRYPGALTHRTSDLALFDVTRIEDIPCTTGTRTCVDLGAVVDEGVVERAFECAVRRGLTTPDYAARRARALARRGRKGPAVLLRVLARRQERANGSDLETRFEQLCRASGVKGLLRQVPIGPFVADFADLERRIVVELDGLATHATSTALQADLTRQNYLVLQGWTVLRFTWEDVTQRQAAVVAALGCR